MVLGKLKPEPDRLHMLWFQWPLLTDNAALVPGGAKREYGR